MLQGKELAAGSQVFYDHARAWQERLTEGDEEAARIGEIALNLAQRVRCVPEGNLTPIVYTYIAHMTLEAYGITPGDKDAAKVTSTLDQLLSETMTEEVSSRYMESVRATREEYEQVSARNREDWHAAS